MIVLLCPYPCASTNIKDFLWILYGSKEQLVVEGQEEKMVTVRDSQNVRLVRKAPANTAWQGSPHAMLW